MGTTEYDSALTAQVESLAAEVRDTRSVLQAENVKRDERIATNRRSTRWALRAARIGIGVGVIGTTTALLFAWSLSAQVDKNESDRLDARVSTCTNYNEQQRTAYAAEVVQARILVKALVPDLALADAETRRRVAAYLIEHDSQAANSHQERDCSAAGIEAYYDDDTTNDRPPYPEVPVVSTTSP